MSLHGTVTCHSVGVSVLQKMQVARDITLVSTSDSQ